MSQYLTIYRPIPCGKYGTYAHYGLIGGLLGFSIGATSQDVRFYLDKLVEKFPDMFSGTVVDVHSKTSSVSAKFTRFQKSLLKWRWSIIKKANFGKTYILIITASCCSSLL